MNDVQKPWIHKDFIHRHQNHMTISENIVYLFRPENLIFEFPHEFREPVVLLHNIHALIYTVKTKGSRNSHEFSKICRSPTILMYWFSEAVIWLQEDLNHHP